MRKPLGYCEDCVKKRTTPVSPHCTDNFQDEHPLCKLIKNEAHQLWIAQSRGIDEKQTLQEIDGRWELLKKGQLFNFSEDEVPSPQRKLLQIKSVVDVVEGAKPAKDETEKEKEKEKEAVVVGSTSRCDSFRQMIRLPIAGMKPSQTKTKRMIRTSRSQRQPKEKLQ